jgi:hypothetical protein
MSVTHPAPTLADPNTRPALPSGGMKEGRCRLDLYVEGILVLGP